MRYHPGSRARLSDGAIRRSPCRSDCKHWKPVAALAVCILYSWALVPSAAAKDKLVLGAAFGIAEELALRGDVFWFPSSRFVVMGGTSYLPGSAKRSTEVYSGVVVGPDTSIVGYAYEYTTKMSSVYVDALVGVHAAFMESGFVYFAVGGTWVSADPGDSRPYVEWSIDDAFGLTIAAGMALPVATRLLSYASLRQRYAYGEAEMDVLGAPLIRTLNLGGIEADIGLAYEF